MNLCATQNKIFLNEQQINNITFLLGLYQNLTLINLNVNNNEFLKRKILQHTQDTINFRNLINESNYGLNEEDKAFLLIRLVQLRILIDKQRIKTPNSPASKIKNEIYQQIMTIKNELQEFHK